MATFGGLGGYTNPMRSMERRMNPSFAQREFRDPGLSRTGLGSMHHTMPHLRNLSGMPHFQSGGDVMSQIAQLAGTAAGPSAAFQNWYNPDPRERLFLSRISQPNLSGRNLMGLQATTFPYQKGGEAPSEEEDRPDPEELESPEQQMTPQEGEERRVVMEALAALEGESPDPEAALKAFIDIFGPRALADLQQLAEEKHYQEQSGDEDADAEGGMGDGQEDQMAQLANQMQGSSGGLLRGPGSGQSDEIEGVTPSGHPVLLSDGEYVIDAPTVAALGDGSTDAGARRLDELRKQIRMSTYGSDKQAKPMAKGGKPFTLKIP